MDRIKNVRLPQPLESPNTNTLWWILIDDQKKIISINQIEDGMTISGEDWEGDLLSPMGIDLQFNGGLGLAFPELTPKDLPKLLKLLDKLWNDGVEAICPTFVSCEVSLLRMGLNVLRSARKKHCEKRCQLLGAHLEGPFLAKSHKGAHSKQWLSAPNLQALNNRIKGFESEISLITLAPELPGASDLIERLKSLEIIISLGHSAANAQSSSMAFNQGVSMITHTFNAMPGLNHRDPGPIGEAIENGKIAMGLIADGVHVHPSMAVLLQKLAPKQIILVSDALSAYGLDEGKHIWDKKGIYTEQGTCRLEDGTLAGTTQPLLEGCKKLAQWSMEPSASIWAATIAPRNLLSKSNGLNDHLLGKPLDNLLRWKTNSPSNVLNWQQAA